MSKFLNLKIDGIVPTEGKPSTEDLISGNPVQKGWTVDSVGEDTGSGVWQSTPGKWHFANSHWEYCRILNGVSIITEDSGESYRVTAGDSFILRPGFKGTWEVVETTTKEYVYRDC